MVKDAVPSIRIDLNEFKLHIDLKKESELTLHFNSPSRMFYLSVIALVVNEMKKSGKVSSIPLEKHFDLLVLLNESVGGSAGSSDKKNLLARIYKKWKDALPNLEEAPLYKILGRKKEYDEGADKTYVFTETVKDSWANLFEYKGSDENVRLKFSIDKIGASLDDVIIVYEDALNGDAWEKFLLGLKGRVENAPEIAVVQPPGEVPAVPISPISGQKSVRQRRQLRAVLIAIIAVVAALAVWKLYLSTALVETASREKMAFPLPDKPSIAVLPFKNISGEKEQEYFSDGLAEGIIDGLSKSDRIFVIARNSTFTYKGKAVKVKQVAEEMGVQYVIEGSVQKEKNRVRITVQLIDAMTGHHLFSERYDRDMKDILKLQDEITMKLLAAVQVKLTVGEVAHFTEKGTKNLDAYLKVLQIMELKAGTMNKEVTQRVMKLAEEAIALDPGYAIPYSILAIQNFELVLFGASQSPKESLQRAIELGKKAIALDDDNSYTHAAMVYPYTMLGEYDKAISEAEKSVSLDPNSPGGYFGLGTALSFAGRPHEAIPMLQKCLRLSPIPIHSEVLGVLANSYRQLGRYEKAVATNKKQIDLYGPDHLLAHLNLAITYVLMGREKEARTEGAEVLRIDPKFSIERYVKGIPLGQQPGKDRLTALLSKAGLK